MNQGGINMHRKKLSARCLSIPENRAAFLAVEDVLGHFASARSLRLPQPLFVHGPAGVGKSYLVSRLVRDVSALAQGHILTVLPAGDLWGPAANQPETSEPTPAGFVRPYCDADLLVVEDLQHLRMLAVEGLVQILDERASKRLPTVVTARVGPRHLGRGGESFPARLTNRLAGGLVVSIDPWGPASRLLCLEELAQIRQFAVPPGILPWLAEHLPGSGRVLEGAMSQLEILAGQQRRPLTVDQVAEHFRSQGDAHQPTVERIARQVSGYFRLEPGLLQSRSRYRNILLPRQVSMYLARKLTEMSLQQIGAFFGGRDHSTVLHACRKMEQALATDAELSGAVRQLHAELV